MTMPPVTVRVEPDGRTSALAWTAHSDIDGRRQLLSDHDHAGQPGHSLYSRFLSSQRSLERIAVAWRTGERWRFESVPEAHEVGIRT